MGGDVEGFEALFDGQLVREVGGVKFVDSKRCCGGFLDFQGALRGQVEQGSVLLGVFEAGVLEYLPSHGAAAKEVWDVVFSDAAVSACGGFFGDVGEASSRGDDVCGYHHCCVVDCRF